MFKNTSLLALLLVMLTACPKKDDIFDDKKDAAVTKFIYDGMSAYYLWADGMKDKRPGNSTGDPKSYFSSLLSTIDKEHGWSWMTDDVDGLLADFAGNPKGFGWALSVYGVSGSSTDVVGIVTHVFPNTPAAGAGITRRNVIDRINGETLTRSNYTKLYGGDPVKIRVSDSGLVVFPELTVTPQAIQTNPVHTAKVFEGAEFAGKKIGYLFYTDFIENYNNKLYEAFATFKTQGITDLVIDLRYNHGGAGSAAVYMASLIAPRNVVSDPNAVFTELSYNSFLNNYYDDHGINRKTGFVRSGALNPLNANLNLSTVYIIATSDSYSSAELITFCLKPYMNVVHIGERTGGKFTGSWTIHAYDNYDNEAVPIYNEGDLNAKDKASLRKWAMQPIVATYKDKNGADFTNPGYLVPTIPINFVPEIESRPHLWKPIGDKNDYMLAKAISLITGLPVPQSAVIPATAVRNVYKRERLFFPKDHLLKESVRLEPPAGETGKNLLLKLQEQTLRH